MTCVSVCFEALHEWLPLQSQSALSWCFHGSSRSQHSQPYSLPSLHLVGAGSLQLTSSFLSFFGGATGSLGIWIHFIALLRLIHLRGVDQTTKGGKNRNRGTVRYINQVIHCCTALLLRFFIHLKGLLITKRDNEWKSR